MNELPHGYPIHFVITLRRRDAVGSTYGVSDILASFACDLSDADALYERYIAPLAARGIHCDRWLFSREGPNPFLEAEAKQQQAIDEMLAKLTAERKPAAPDYTSDAAWEEPQ